MFVAAHRVSRQIRENLSGWPSEVVSRVFTKGWRGGGVAGWRGGGVAGWRGGGVAGWGRRRGGGRWGGQGPDLKMEVDHDWSPETRLQSCASSLVADM